MHANLCSNIPQTRQLYISQPLLFMRPTAFSTNKCGVLEPDTGSACTAGSSGYRGCFCARAVLTSSLVELTPQQSQRVSLPRGGTGRTLYGGARQTSAPGKDGENQPAHTEPQEQPAVHLFLQAAFLLRSTTSSH